MHERNSPILHASCSFIAGSFTATAGTIARSTSVVLDSTGKGAERACMAAVKVSGSRPNALPFSLHLRAR